MKRRKGFTLIELLVVIVIILILAAILFPAFMAARRRARAVSCMSNLKQMGTAFATYQGNYNGKFPYTVWPSDAASSDMMGSYYPLFPGYGTRFHNWLTKLKPYVSQPEVFGFTKSVGGAVVYGEAIGVARCPEQGIKWRLEPFLDRASYGYNWLYLGIPFPRWQTGALTLPGCGTFPAGSYQGYPYGPAKLSQLKSPGETIVLVDNKTLFAFPPRRASAPTQYQVGTNLIRPRHSKRSNILWADSHVSAKLTKELVSTPMPFGNMMHDDDGTATDNSLWDRE